MFLRHERATTPALLQINFPADWLESLSSLLKWLAKKKPEFQTVDALLAAAAGDDAAAGNMLKRILYWHGTLNREFYLSKKDWWEQCRVRRKTIDRVKAEIFPLCGVSFTVKYTGKANTTYYRLHEWKFLRRLAEVMGLPMLFLADKLCTKRAERCVQNEPNVVSKTDATLTRESTSNTSKEQVVNDSVVDSKIVNFKSDFPENTPHQMQVIELLKSAGVRGAIAYAVLPEDIVRACIASANEPGVRDRTRYLVGALKKQLQAHNTQTQSSKPLSESVATETPSPNPFPSGGEAGTRRDEQISEPESINEKLSALVAANMTAYQAWSAAHHQLSLQLDRTSYDYVRAAKLLDYEADCFTVKVHSPHARDMLQHRLYKNVARIMRDVVGHEVEVRFEADEENAAGQGLKRFLKMNAENTQEGKSS